ncbi:protein kinase [Nocardia sp. NPDC051030]|uniref:serine/threonine-protein kinase n=1 Tax=Nocardia sp. NPDC051030 TaxID=3155162 RepID=UPI003423EFAC
MSVGDLSGSDIGRVRAALPGYEVGGQVGRGGCGVVLSGTHRGLHRRVAIKQVPPQFAHDMQVRRRFVAEARVMAALDHPHVVPVYDYIEHEDLCLLVLEYLPGGTVENRFVSAGFEATAAVAVALSCAAGLDAAHRHGILHRDVKPSNLMFAANGTLKLTDFGIAKIVGGDDTLVTKAGEIIGTPAYISPEQVRGQQLSPATDVYALATMLYQLLSGVLPFPPGEDTLSMLFAHAYGDPIPLAEVAPGVPQPIAEAVMRGLAGDPAHRFDTAESFGIALAEPAAQAWGTNWLTPVGIPVIGADTIVAAATGGVRTPRPAAPSPFTPPPQPFAAGPYTPQPSRYPTPAPVHDPRARTRDSHPVIPGPDVDTRDSLPIADSASADSRGSTGDPQRSGDRTPPPGRPRPAPSEPNGWNNTPRPGQQRGPDSAPETVVRADPTQRGWVDSRNAPTQQSPAQRERPPERPGDPASRRPDDPAARPAGAPMPGRSGPPPRPPQSSAPRPQAAPGWGAAPMTRVRPLQPMPQNGVRLVDVERSDLVPVQRVVTLPSPRVPFIAAAVLTAAVAGAAVLGVGAAPERNVPPVGMIQLAGGDPGMPGSIELDLSKPVPVTVTGGDADSAKLSLDLLGAHVGGTDTALNGATGEFASPVNQYVVAGDLTAELTLSRNGSETAHYTFGVHTVQRGLTTVAAGAILLLILFAAAYAESNARTLRHGYARFTSTIGLAVSAGLLGVAAVGASWILLGREPSITGVALCAAGGVAAGLAFAVACRRIGKRYRYVRRQLLSHRG